MIPTHLYNGKYGYSRSKNIYNIYKITLLLLSKFEYSSQFFLYCYYKAVTMMSRLYPTDMCKKARGEGGGGIIIIKVFFWGGDYNSIK